jgi:tetratricopeptide (TPR) repeat protein
VLVLIAAGTPLVWDDAREWLRATVSGEQDDIAVEIDETGFEGRLEVAINELRKAIGAMPQDKRELVEAIAQEEGVPSKLLYGILSNLQVDTSSDRKSIEGLLRQSAKAFLRSKSERVQVTFEDEKLTRLVELRDRASAEGAIDLSREYSVRGIARANELSNTLDQRERRLMLERARVSAMRGAEAFDTSDFPAAIEHYSEAYALAHKFDEISAALYKFRAGKAAQRTGDLLSAFALHKDSLLIRERLLASDPNNAFIRLNEVADSYQEIGSVQLARGNYSAALAAYRNEFNARERTVSFDPDNARLQTALGYSAQRIGDVLTFQGNLNEALASHDTGHALLARAASMAPDDLQAQRSLAISHSKLGELRRRMGDLAGSLPSYRASVDILKTLASADPANVSRQRDLAVSYQEMGSVQKDLGDFDGALKSQRAGRAVFEALVEVDSSNIDRQRDLASSDLSLSQLFLLQDDFANAHDAVSESLKILNRLVATNPADLQLQHDLAQAFNQAGAIQYADEEFEQAIGSHSKATDILQRLADAEPASKQRQRDLAQAHWRVGAVQVSQKNYAAAVSSYRLAVGIAEAALANSNENDDMEMLAILYRQSAAANKLHGNKREAVEAYDKAVATTERQVDMHGNSTRSRTRLAGVLEESGKVRASENDIVGAAKAYERSLEIRKQLYETDPDNTTFAGNLALRHFRTGEFYRDDGQADLARTQFERAEQLARDLVTKEPDVERWQVIQKGVKSELDKLQAAPALPENTISADPENATTEVVAADESGVLNDDPNRNLSDGILDDDPFETTPESTNEITDTITLSETIIGMEDAAQQVIIDGLFEQIRDNDWSQYGLNVSFGKSDFDYRLIGDGGRLYIVDGEPKADIEGRYPSVAIEGADLLGRLSRKLRDIWFVHSLVALADDTARYGVDPSQIAINVNFARSSIDGADWNTIKSLTERGLTTGAFQNLYRGDVCSLKISREYQAFDDGAPLTDCDVVKLDISNVSDTTYRVHVFHYSSQGCLQQIYPSAAENFNPLIEPTSSSDTAVIGATKSKSLLITSRTPERSVGREGLIVVAAKGENDAGQLSFAEDSCVSHRTRGADYVFSQVLDLLFAPATRSRTTRRITEQSDVKLAHFQWTVEEYPAVSDTPASRLSDPGAEIAFWETVKNGNDPALYEAYLKEYPEGTFSAAAQAKLDELRAQGTAPAEPAATPDEQDVAAVDPAETPKTNLYWSLSKEHDATISVSFYSEARAYEWPGNRQVWLLENSSQKYTFNLSCNKGENICFGAWERGAPDTYWGVGRDRKFSCTNCCHVCDGSTVQNVKFVSADGTDPIPKDEPAVEPDRMNTEDATTANRVVERNKRSKLPAEETPPPEPAEEAPAPESVEQTQDNASIDPADEQTPSDSTDPSGETVPLDRKVENPVAPQSLNQANPTEPPTGPQRDTAATPPVSAEELAAEAEALLGRSDFSGAAEQYAAAYQQIADTDSARALTYKLGEADALSKLGRGESDPAPLQEAAKASRVAIEIASRSGKPDTLARAQSMLGSALLLLGIREQGTENLETAVTAFEAALEVTSRRLKPQNWAAAQRELGHALLILGQRQSGQETLQRSVEAFEVALEVTPRADTPRLWAETQANLGRSLFALGVRETGNDNLERAAAAYLAALDELTRGDAPTVWARTQFNLGIALSALGARQEGTTNLERSATAFRLALQVRTRQSSPFDWALTQMNLGLVQQSLGMPDNDTQKLREAVALYRSALEVFTRGGRPLEWARTQRYLASALLLIGQREADVALVALGRKIAEEARDLYTERGMDRFIEEVGGLLAEFDEELSKMNPPAADTTRQQRGSVTSAYTDLVVDENCRSQELGDGESRSVCAGYEGYLVHYTDNVASKKVEFGYLVSYKGRVWADLNAPFYVGDTVEWRLGNGRPFATILRWHYPESETRSASGERIDANILAVSKVGQPDVFDACIVGFVDARANADANEIARTVADTYAADFRCGSDRPKFHGTIGATAQALVLIDG